MQKIRIIKEVPDFSDEIFEGKATEVISKLKNYLEKLSKEGWTGLYFSRVSIFDAFTLIGQNIETDAELEERKKRLKQKAEKEKEQYKLYLKLKEKYEMS